MTSALYAWEPYIHAFVELSDVPVTKPSIRPGPLAGLTVGVKDIIDVAGLPTRNGSAVCADAMPAEHDAVVVERLRAAGAQIVGKTITTEFAFTDPTPCRNPHDLSRSPGGSSSGSGAAVGAGVVDIALGTQTAGSLIRPAAYCGAVGFKPSAGLFPMGGVTPLARSFDTVGIIARDVSLGQRAARVLAPAATMGALNAPKVACGIWDTKAEVSPDWLQALDDARGALGTLSGVTEIVLPADVGSVVSAHRCVMCAEAFAAHHALLDDNAQMLKPNFRAGLEAGRDLDKTNLSEARTLLTGARTAFWDAMRGTDLILTLPVPDGAPLIDGTTGFQDWLTPWTVFGGPLVCLPWGIDTLLRPRSVMLAAHPGQDLFLLEMAARLEHHAPRLSAPRLPR